MSLVDDVKRALLLKRLLSRIKEAREMGKLQAVLFGIVGAVATAVVAQVTAACPDLLSQAPAILTGSVGAAIAYLWPKQSGAKATLAGATAALVAGLMQQLQAACGADFVHQLPTLATAGLWLGIGAWLQSKRG